MSLPGNGIFVLRGEISTLMTAIKRGARWNTPNYQEEEPGGLLKQFSDLKTMLINIEDLRLIDPNVFLASFLEVIRSEETTGQITSLALSALNKFLSYGLIDPTHSKIAVTVENIADAVTHARFVGSDQASDGVVLMKIVQVLRTLMLSPEGSALTNESVCEVMLSCFRICFEPRLNELLRRTAEHALKDIILLLFMRLPQFAEERTAGGLIKKLKMMANGGGIDATSKRRKLSKSSNKSGLNTANNKPAWTTLNASAPPTIRCDDSDKDGESSRTETAGDPVLPNPSTPNQLLAVQKLNVLATTPSTPVVGNIVDMQGKFMQTPHTENDDKVNATECDAGNNDEAFTVVSSDRAPSTNATGNQKINPFNEVKLKSLNLLHDDNVENDADVEENATDESAKMPISTVDLTIDINTSLNAHSITRGEDFVNSMGVRFTPQSENEAMASTVLAPYGLPCIRELLRFLITLCNPLDKQNTDAMIHMGLTLLTIALEVGADSIGKYDTLLEMVKDDLCRNVFALLSTERLTIFAADLQVCFLLFESQRNCLKFHLEFYLNKLAEIIGSENPRTPYEIRELALDNLLQFLRIPSFSAELYINYDCNLYCTNLLEDLVKLLSKNALSATQAIYTIHETSLDGLLTIITDIERNCLHIAKQNAHSGGMMTITSGRHSRTNSSVDKITLDKSGDLHATTSGGEDSSTIENIHSFISKKNTTINIGAIDERTISDNQERMDVMTHEQLVEIKNRKRILTQGTELFNQRPDKGIQFLQENNYLNPQLDPIEVAQFLRENSSLDKKMIGEYISKKKNVESKILEKFVKSFNFAGMRIDMALRQYLETFRLPGEAPLIFLVMEHFADHWHKMNNEPFADTDAAFSLAYAVIMLNMDQHNHNAKRLNIPMTAEDFQKNLRGVNGKSDFDQDMLLAIFNSIKNDEIIMPAEQTGLVRENYLWKVLLRRNKTKDGVYLDIRGNFLDKDIFQLVWGPTLAALSFMFDRSTDTTYNKSLLAFAKGAAISAHFMLHDDFNALILTLCKFTTLLNNVNGTNADGSASLVVGASVTSASITNEITTSVQFGLSIKAQLAMKSVFAMVHKHGDCLRCDGWKNVIEVVLQLFKLKLLPKSLMEVEDFCEASGKVTLMLEKPMQKQEVGLFSSIYLYLSSDGQRQPTSDEQEIIKIARRCVKECQLDQIIGESKFLHVDALRKLIRCLLDWLKPPSSHKSEGVPYAEDTKVFLMEFLVKILIQNRDRLLPLWSDCRDQIYLLLLGSSTYGYNYLLLRTTVALLKLAIYLMRNEELCPVVLQSLKMFLLLKPTIILKISKQISTGLYELLKTSAQNIHTEGDWDIVFTLLECVGAGSIPQDYEDSIALSQAYRGAKSEGALSSDNEDAMSTAAQARGYISDSEIPIRLHSDPASLSNRPGQVAASVTENWIIVNKDSDITMTSRPTSPIHSLVYPCKLMRHSTFALVKCWDSLAFIVRNVAHITPYNFESCVKCIRTFVEASINGGNLNSMYTTVRVDFSRTGGRHAKSANYKQRETLHGNNGNTVANASTSSTDYPMLNDSDGDSEGDELLQRYETIAIQLLDLMHTLHTRTAQIFRWWAEEGGALPQCSALWALGWCPILQGIARLATDQRRQVRTSAVTCLQRALLVHDLQALTGPEWESCFKQVLFPLLYELLAEVPNPKVDSNLLEESRMRTATIMSKVFLHHLTPLVTLPTFGELWLDILDYIEKFMNIGSDMLHEAMLESLKNMLLVMHSVRVFHNNDRLSHSPLWKLTWNRVDQFLPHLKEELFEKEPMLENSIYASEQQTKEKSQPQVDQMQTSIMLQSHSVQSNHPEKSEHHLMARTSIILQPPENILVNQNAPLLVNAHILPQSDHQIPILLQNASATNYLSQIGQTKGSISAAPMQPSNYSDSQVTATKFPANDNQSLSFRNDYDPIKTSAVISSVSAITTAAAAVVVASSGSNMSIKSQPIIAHSVEDSFAKKSHISSLASCTDYTQNGPSINPNFSNIIELPVTPSPPPILEVDETLENNTNDDVANFGLHTPYSHVDAFTGVKRSKILPLHASSTPQIPLSHLVTPNQYPSLNKIPSANIVQSFAPLYVHSQPIHPQLNEVGEIYSDYVNNPYNLTLQVDQNYSSSAQLPNEPTAISELDHDALNLPTEASPLTVATSKTNATPASSTYITSNSNVFQSVNYFGSSDATIPPGSEMLFNGP